MPEGGVLPSWVETMARRHRQSKSGRRSRRHGEGGQGTGNANGAASKRDFARVAITSVALLAAWQLTTEKPAKPAINGPWPDRRQSSQQLSLGSAVQQLIGGDESEEDEGLDEVEFDGGLAIDGILSDEDFASIQRDRPHFKNYAYLIVTYHKSGHALSHTLANYLMRYLKLKKNMFSKIERHDFVSDTVRCSKLSLIPGSVTVIEAPEFHCNREKLANLLMHNQSRKKKWGVKLIHLVRNPFSMAVSNYLYHRQDPTPEPFVHTKDPCSTLTGTSKGKEGYKVADLVTPVLSHPGMTVRMKGIKTLSARTPIMERGDFDKIVEDCYSLYRTKPGLESASYYEHLRNLPNTEGIRLSTADKFSHIAYMASNMLLFDHVTDVVNLRKEKRETGVAKKYPNRQRDIYRITLPLDDWIEQPGVVFRRFLDFIFQEYMPEDRKVDLSQRYESNYLREKETWDHVTSVSKNIQESAELIKSLRRSPVFGEPMEHIESLLDEILRRESGGVWCPDGYWHMAC